MYGIFFTPLLDGRLTFQYRRKWQDNDEDGLELSFTCGTISDRRKALRFVRELIEKHDLNWIDCSGTDWKIYIDRFRSWFQSKYTDANFFESRKTGNVNQPQNLIQELSWLHQDAICVPEHETADRDIIDHQPRFRIVLRVPRLEYEINMQSRVFLSHKTADKKRVEQFYLVLKELGYEPWFDQEDMPAGTVPHRGIDEGMEQSCAAVFFITSAFRDETYLGMEINKAISQALKKGKDRFVIITIVLPEEGGLAGSVPKPLMDYIYKTPESDLMALKEIIRAIPLTNSALKWRR